MVYSMFLVNKNKNDDVVICYISFDYKIIKLLRSKQIFYQFTQNGIHTGKE